MYRLFCDFLFRLQQWSDHFIRWFNSNQAFIINLRADRALKEKFTSLSGG